MELSSVSVVSMLPYHTATASAVLTSMLSVAPRSHAWTLEGNCLFFLNTHIYENSNIFCLNSNRLFVSSYSKHPDTMSMILLVCTTFN